MILIPCTHISPKIITSLHLSQVTEKLWVLSSTQICKQLLVFPGGQAAGMWKFPLISIPSMPRLRRSVAIILLSLCVFSLCFVYRASRYSRIKETQLDAQLILSIFRQLLHVSGVSRPIIRRYNRMYTTIGTYYSF